MKHTILFYFTYLILAFLCITHCIFFYTIGMELISLKLDTELSPIHNLILFTFTTLPIVILALFIKVELLYKRIYELEIDLIKRQVS